jgi:septum formation protein
MRFILASASPARLATLRSAGIEPEVIVSGVDESAITADDTAALVQRLANRKASAVSERVHGDALILACDSMLEFGGQSLGKPVSTDETIARWRELRGRRAILHTGHCLYEAATSRVSVSTVKTFVHFADVTDAEIELYVATGEPANVAGGFTIDGLGGWFIEGISGDHHNVIGVSLPVLRRMLRELGYTVADLGYPSR